MPQAGQQDVLDGLRTHIARMLDSLDQRTPLSTMAVFKVDPARENEFIRSADALSEATRHLPGCKQLIYQKAIQGGPPSAPIEYAVSEIWETVQLFKNQRESACVKRFQDTVQHLVVELPDFRLYYGAGHSIPRFADHEDGTVVDRASGLIWLKDADAFGSRTWGQALAACSSLGMPSYGLSDGSRPGDWRLPGVKEMESLVDYGNAGPCLPTGHPFLNVRPASYWTSTSVASAPTQAMFMILGVGSVLFENKESSFFVWPVRDPLPAR